MRYTSYKETRYEKKVIIPERKSIGGKRFELAEVFPNYGSHQGHKIALGFAADQRARGHQARVEAHSGFTCIYVRK